MGLFPPSFIEDLKAQADIVQVVQDYVPLKKAGSREGITVYAQG